MHSRSLRPLIEGTGGRDFAYMEWDLNASRCGVELQLRTVRTRTHKLTLELISGAGELYDLASDPHETTNRFDDPGLHNRAARAHRDDHEPAGRRHRADRAGRNGLRLFANAEGDSCRKTSAW